MRRIIAVVFIILLAAAIITGCGSRNDYQVFTEAMERTEAVERGKMSMDMAIQVDFNEEGLSEEVKDFIDYFKEFKISLTDEFNNQDGEGLNKIFIQAGDMGIDAKLYTRNGIAYIITPLIPKILVIDGEELLGMYSGKIDEKKFPKLSNESLEQLKKVWIDLYNQENVAAIEDIVLDTPEGKVKARKFKVMLTDEQIKPALKKSMEIFIQDEQLMEGLNDMMNSDNDECSIEDMFRVNMEMLDQSTINSFNQVAYIDRDNYVINERIGIDVIFHFAEPGTPRNYNFNMSIKRWDLNKEPDIYFPEVTFENSITVEQLKNQYPKVFEEMKEDMR